MKKRPNAELRRFVIDRAEDRCEYCLIPQHLVASSHQVDHIIPDKHGGLTSEVNLALSCSLCNLRKASDLAALDPATGNLIRLFNPREQEWYEHFRCEGGEIIGLTEVGRTTAHFLQFNSFERIAERLELLNAGVVLDSHLSRKRPR